MYAIKSISAIKESVTDIEQQCMKPACRTNATDNDKGNSYIAPTCLNCPHTAIVDKKGNCNKKRHHRLPAS